MLQDAPARNLGYGQEVQAGEREYTKFPSSLKVIECVSFARLYRSATLLRRAREIWIKREQELEL